MIVQQTAFFVTAEDYDEVAVWLAENNISAWQRVWWRPTKEHHHEDPAGYLLTFGRDENAVLFKLRWVG